VSRFLAQLLAASVTAVTTAMWIAPPAPRSVHAQTTIDPALAVEVYADGFTSPSFMRFLPVVGTTELFICEIGSGRILHYRGGALAGIATDFAVAFLFERGLFGVALHPDFAVTPWVYAYYTASATGGDTDAAGGALDNRVVRMRWNGTTLDSLQVLLQLPVGPNHNGGALGFGPDGMLYGSIGEAGTTQGQMQNIATGTPADRTSMIFRIAPDGSIPPDNPFAALGGAMAPVFAYGLRNVFGLDFDPASGALWVTDNGAALYDEIVRVPAGGNGGWSRIAGPVARDTEGTSDLWNAPGSIYVDPEFSFRQSFGITAIHFQRGAQLGSQYENTLFVAAHNSMTIYRFDLSADRTALVMPDSTLDDRVADNLAERDLLRWAQDVGVVTDMETGPDGALYVLRFSSPSTLYRVARRPTSGTAPPPPTVPGLMAMPNPSRAGVTLSATHGATGLAAPVSLGPLRIIDVAGRVVRRLPVTQSMAYWDGRDDRGRGVAPGTYWVAAPGTTPARIVRLR
jgi:glucose/arabinose dehydrogenase